MRTVETKIYKLEELNEKAKEKAYEKYWLESEYFFHDESIASLMAFKELFDIEYLSYSYCSNQAYVDFELDEGLVEESNLQEMKGVRLYKYIVNNYWDDLFLKRIYFGVSKYENGKYIPSRKRVSKIFYSTSCVLTGYYVDDSILNPLYEYLKNPRMDITLEKLIKECFNQWLTDCQSDYDYFYSQENFEEEMKSLEWEFYEDGTIYSY